MNWKCTVCNLLWEGESPPEKCPKCASPAEKYNQLTDEQWDLVERSRLTNDIHINLLNILPELKSMAQQGIADDLDAHCVAVFKRLYDEAEYLERSIKAELNGHVMRGKWG